MRQTSNDATLLLKVRRSGERVSGWNIILTIGKNRLSQPLFKIIPDSNVRIGDECTSDEQALEKAREIALSLGMLEMEIKRHHETEGTLGFWISKH